MKGTGTATVLRAMALGLHTIFEVKSASEMAPASPHEPPHRFTDNKNLEDARDDVDGEDFEVELVLPLGGP